MFPFKIRFTKTIRKPITSNDIISFLEYVEDLLKEKHVNNLVKHNLGYKFKNHLFSLSGNWRLMAYVDSGYVELKKEGNNLVKIVYEITSFQNDSVFRFWDGNKVVQIEKNSKSSKGDVFFFLREHNGDSQKSERLYSSSMSLDSNTINKILELFSDFKIFEFPSDSKIQGWEKGLDGSTYLTEFNCPNYYSVKSYWTPTVQEKVKEARFLQYFINELNIIDEIMTDIRIL
nr:hypothetical protein [uncultured Carboxylicivirga sp.]